MRVLMLPAGQDRRVNPYTHLLCEALRTSGVEVLSASTPRGALRRCDVLHVHWPHNYASIPDLKVALVRSTLLLVLSGLTRVRGGRIVWTVHDLKSLRRNNEWLERLVMAAFTRLADGLVFLNGTSEAALAEARPALAALPSAQIPHGVYGGAYPPPAPQALARRQLGLAETGFVIACPGDIKPYKDPTPVIRAIAAAGPAGPSLLLAGRCDPPEYEPAIVAEVAAAGAAGAPVTWLNARLADDQLAQVIDACDVVALPYSRSWNSGLAILALERRRRLLCSDLAGFRELATELGPYWVHVAEGGIDASTVLRLDRGPATPEDEARLDRFIARRQWAEVAQDTAAFYRSLAHAA